VDEFTLHASFADYQGNAMMRSAVERQLEIIGEAVSKLSDIDQNTAGRITGRPRIIGFRNRLIHGYRAVNDRLVWDIVQTNLPLLRREVEAMLEDE
jgi:uncharacterized protein with HEPN domain